MKNKSVFLKRWSRFIQLLTVASLIAACALPRATVSPQPDIALPFQRFENKLNNLRRSLHIPGMSVAVLLEKEVVFEKGFGYADIERQIPATATTSYHIASLTKPFSAAIVMRLVENGKLKLDDEMSDILKDADFYRSGYHAHGYAALCEGIRKVAWRYGSQLRDYRCHNNPILVKHHVTHTSQGRPGSRYRYNGFLFSFLTEVVEQVSQKPFAEMLVERIIAPLEMMDTVPSIDAERRKQTLLQRANYYQLNMFGRPVPSTKRPLNLSASAGMISTVIDIAKFDVAMDRDLVVSQSTREMMHSPTISIYGQALPYGIGWFVQHHKDIKLIWHYGHVPRVCSSLILKLPERELTMILLANSDGASRNFNLGKGDVLNSPFARLFIESFTDMGRTVR
jgi:CubicO group peptidase (beta-lactamase class C family)